MKLSLNTFVKYLKSANFILATFFLVLFSIFAYSSISNQASAFYGTSMVPASVNGIPVNVQALTDNFSANATYTAGYRIYSPNNQEITFQIQTQTNHCTTPNGDPNSQYGACMDNPAFNTQTINLNSGNNYAQDVTVSVTQEGNRPCGSLQTDINFPEGSGWKFILGSLHYTGKAMSECPVASPSPSPSVSPSPSISPSPKPSHSPSPKPSVSPSPSASASPSTIQCPVGKVSKVVDSTIICVSQNQNQTQTQTQNNNQNQNVNQNVTATGGSSSSSSSSSSSVNVTVNNPTPAPTATPSTTTIVLASNTTTYQSQPQVVTQVKGDVKELPKTGLPLAALALGGLFPAGLGIKRFAKKPTQEASANSIWTDRQLNS